MRIRGRMGELGNDMKLIVKMICMAFLLAVLARGVAMGDTIDAIIAVVDDRLIMQSDLDARMESLDLDPADNAKAKKVLDLMIEETVIEKTYDKFGLPPVDPSQINAIVAQNRTSFASARIAVMRKTLMDMMVSSRVVVTPQMIKAYYDSTPRYSGRLSLHLKQIAVKGDQARAEAAKAEIKANQPFDEVAKTYSDILAAGSPDIGWVALEDLDKSAGIALEHAKPGDIVGPVPVKEYYCIFEVGGRELTGKKDLDEVKGEIINNLEDKARDEAFEHWLKQIMSEHYIGIYI